MSLAEAPGAAAAAAAATVVRNVCAHDCPDRCSILSRVVDGRLVEVGGDPEHPVTQGFLCRKMRRYPRWVHGPERLRYPLQRVGAKGSGRFRRLTWEQAIAAIAGRWRALVAEHGPQAILPFYGSGNQGIVHGELAGKRFFNRLGTLQLDRTICSRAGRVGYEYTMGSSVGADPGAIAGARMVVAWGANTPATNVHHLPRVRQARANGAHYAVVNPVRIGGAEGADHLLQPLPGTDAALALAMMHVIVAEDLYDHAFVKRFTHGFESLAERLRSYPPARAARITGVAARDIEAFARAYAARRPSFIYLGSGAQHHSNGGMTVRTVACLPALVGAWRAPGGGVFYPTSSVVPLEWGALEGADLRPQPPRAYNMNHLGRMLSAQRPRVHSLYVFDGNPAAVLTDQNRLRQGLGREDLFTVVHDLFMTDTARYADIVLPATSPFEHVDLLVSLYDLSLNLNQQAIAPVGECKSNRETFSLLAAAMGFDDPCFGRRDWDVVAEVLGSGAPALEGVTLAALIERGYAGLARNGARGPLRMGHLATPSGKIELYSEAMAKAGLDPLPAYLAPSESQAATPQVFRRYPLHLLTPSGHSFLNSNFAQAAGFTELDRRPTLIIHPEDAAPRGIGDGDLVRVFNGRGSCLLWAAVRDEVRSGVVASPGQWWDRRCPGGANPNHTTPDFLADMGGGSAFNTNLVEVKKAAPGAPPPGAPGDG